MPSVGGSGSLWGTPDRRPTWSYGPPRRAWLRSPPVNPSTSKARALVDEWIRGGVRDVVACPGSRNAPLLLALHEADRDGALRLHVRVDERGAGFLAVGLGARSGRVVPIVVTSGTAVANLHPAVLEASYTGVALLVTSADRPLELVPTGANQTVEQAGLFGPAVRASLVLGPDDDRPGAVELWRSTAVRALDRAAGGTSGDPGPVQLDVPLREPLLPGRPAPPADGSPATAPAPGRPDGGPWTRVPRREVLLAPVAPVPGRATLVVAGHGGGPLPAGACLPAGVPVLAEPSAPAWADPAGGRVHPEGPRVLAVALDGDRPDLRPEQVVVLGRPTLHRSVSRLLADAGVRVLEVPALAPDGRPRPGWTDVAGRVAEVGALPADPTSWAPDPAFVRAWDAACAVAASLTSDDRNAGDAGPTGPALAAATVAALPAGALLVLGSSNPVRDAALAARPRDDVRVLAGRGVSGIDGTVSLAVGAALAHDGPAYALLGDLTFLHDAGGLHVGAAEPLPELTLVVADDIGGGIFTVLEQGDEAHAAAFERVFATPHRADLAALCAAYGVGYRRAGTADLRDALTPTGRPGLRVVHVPIDRTGRRAAAARADAALREALITGR